MTYEQKMARALSGSTPTQEKLAHTFDNMSIEELEAILREPTLEKTALLDQVLGGMIGHKYGKEQKGRGEEHTFGAPQIAASLLLPGGLGYQVGRHMAHHDERIKRGKKKHSSANLGLQDKLDLADSWGRELAHADMEKTAFVGKMVGQLGNKVLGATNASRIGWGAAGGAGVGAVGGALGAGRDEQGNKKWVAGALGGGLLGGAGGAALGAGSKAITEGLAKNTNYVSKHMLGAAKGNSAQFGRAAPLRSTYLTNAAQSANQAGNAAQAAKYTAQAKNLSRVNPATAGMRTQPVGARPGFFQGMWNRIRNFGSST